MNGPCSHGPECRLPWSVHDWSYEALHDAALVARYWDEVVAPATAVGIPPDGVAYLRARYIEDAQNNPEALRQIREWAHDG